MSSTTVRAEQNADLNGNTAAIPPFAAMPSRQTLAELEDELDDCAEAICVAMGELSGAIRSLALGSANLAWCRRARTKRECDRRYRARKRTPAAKAARLPRSARVRVELVTNTREQGMDALSPVPADPDELALLAAAAAGCFGRVGWRPICRDCWQMMRGHCCRRICPPCYCPPCDCRACRGSTPAGRRGVTELLPQHQALIDQSAISPEVALARGYRSVTEKRGARRDLRPVQQRVPALLIPLLDVYGERASYQLRPDEPRVGQDGKSHQVRDAARAEDDARLPAGDARARPQPEGARCGSPRAIRKVDALASVGLRGDRPARRRTAGGEPTRTAARPRSRTGTASR